MVASVVFRMRRESVARLETAQDAETKKDNAAMPVIRMSLAGIEAIQSHQSMDSPNPQANARFSTVAGPSIVRFVTQGSATPSQRLKRLRMCNAASVTNHGVIASPKGCSFKLAGAALSASHNRIR